MKSSNTRTYSRHTLSGCFLGTWLVVLWAGLFWCMGIVRADSFDDLRKAAAQVRSVQADFIQEKHLPILTRPLEARGRFIYRAPHSLRWEYRSPMQTVLLMHQGRVQRFVATADGWQPDAGVDAQSMEFVMQQISAWMSGQFDQTPMFEANLEGARRIHLTPLSPEMGRMIMRIEVVMSEQPGVMRTVTIFEAEDAFTRYTFVAPRINAPIADGLFVSVE